MPSNFFEVLDLLLKYWAIILVVGVWVIGRARAIFKARIDRKKRDAQHDALLTAVNGVGAKVRALEKSVAENQTKEIERHGVAMGEIKYIKGKLEGMHFPFQMSGERAK